MTPEAEKLVTENLGLAYAGARKFVKHSESWEDIHQAALLGLVEAASKYDPTQAKFSTYAYFWIRNHCVDTLRKDNRIGIKDRRGHSLKKNRARKKVIISNNAFTYIEPTDVQYDEVGDKVLGVVPEARRVDPNAPILVEELLRFVTPREAQIISMRHGLNGENQLEWKEIAYRMSYKSKQHAEGIYKGALSKMRQALSHTDL